PRSTFTVPTTVTSCLAREPLNRARCPPVQTTSSMGMLLPTFIILSSKPPPPRWPIILTPSSVASRSIALSCTRLIILPISCSASAETSSAIFFSTLPAPPHPAAPSLAAAHISSRSPQPTPGSVPGTTDRRPLPGRTFPTPDRPLACGPHYDCPW